MEENWLNKARELRQQAFEALQQSPAYLAFKTFDEAVVSLGGTPMMEFPVGRPIADAARRVARAAAERMNETRKLSHTDAAEVALQLKGEPLSIGYLMQEARERGAEIGGLDPLNNFRSSVSKDERFVSLRHNGKFFWWLKNLPVPTNWKGSDSIDPIEELFGSDPSIPTDQKGGPHAEKTN